jgi:histidinol phosphatase-like enzyme
MSTKPPLIKHYSWKVELERGMIELIVFDVDGTLAKIYTLKILPGVQEFFDLLYRSGCEPRPKVAIATNQGGVGLRYWMEQNNFGHPDKYPSEESIDARICGLLQALGADPDLPVYVAFRYKNLLGQWSPVPAGKEDAPRWNPTWRKPSAGMLLQAMQDAGTVPLHTLFVGDRKDDRNAALAAGCKFEWASDFFSRDWSSCETLAKLG